MKHLLRSSLDDHFFPTNRTRKQNVLFTIVNQRLKYDVPSGATHAVPPLKVTFFIPQSFWEKKPLDLLFQLFRVSPSYVK